MALAARGLTVGDVENALRAQNVELPAGRLESKAAQSHGARRARLCDARPTSATWSCKRGADGHLVRLGEVARVEIAPRERRSDFRGNGQRQVGVGIIKQSTANQLEVARGVRAEIEHIHAGLPEGTSWSIAVDNSIFIEESVTRSTSRSASPARWWCS